MSLKKTFVLVEETLKEDIVVDPVDDNITNLLYNNLLNYLGRPIQKNNAKSAATMFFNNSLRGIQIDNINSVCAKIVLVELDIGGNNKKHSVSVCRTYVEPYKVNIGDKIWFNNHRTLAKISK